MEGRLGATQGGNAPPTPSRSEESPPHKHRRPRREKIGDGGAEGLRDLGNLIDDDEERFPIMTSSDRGYRHRISNCLGLGSVDGNRREDDAW